VNVAKALVLSSASDADSASPIGASSGELVSLANKPIIGHALTALCEAGVKEAVVAGPPLALSRIAHALELGDGTCPQIHYLEQDDGSAIEALRAAGPLLGDSAVLVQSADALLWDGFDQLFDGAAASDAIVVLRGAADVVEPAGFYLLSARAVRALQVSQVPRDLGRAIEHIVQKGGRAERRRVEGAWRCDGDPEGLLEANRRLLERLPATVPPPAAGSGIEGRVSLHPSVELTRATIRGPAAIGPGARISDAYVGPYTSIGANAVVEGAEVEHSIVLPGATIAFLGRRLEGSIVGPGAKLFRDFRLPRALRVQVGAGAQISLV
jgi:glucose-1-phosphate thymidylyltransferase